MLYLRVNRSGIVRKVLVDMAFLLTHRVIRLPKYYFEDGLYFLYKNEKSEALTEEYYLTKDKIIKEDKTYFYFNFPIKLEQIVNI